MRCNRFSTILVMVLATGAATVQAATITGTADGPNGGHDTWNLAANWDGGVVPSAAMDAVVGTGITAQAWNTTTPAYTGSLTLNNNSVLQMGWTTNYPESANALGGSGITMNDGSQIRLRLPFTVDFPAIELAGDASIHLSPSTSAHHQTRNFDGAITGAGDLTVIGNNNNTLNLNTASPDWSGDFIANADDSWRVEANIAGAFGTGDVIFNGHATNPAKGVSLIIDTEDVIADTATLFLNGGMDHRQASKLILNADETVGAFFLNGVDLGFGTFDQSSGLLTSNGDPLISGSFTLTVLDTGVPEPSSIVLAAFGLLGLVWCGWRRRRLS